MIKPKIVKQLNPDKVREMIEKHGHIKSTEAFDYYGVQYETIRDMQKKGRTTYGTLLKLQQKIGIDPKELIKPEMDNRQCRDCQYRTGNHDAQYHHCNYFFITGETKKQPITRIDEAGSAICNYHVKGDILPTIQQGVRDDRRFCVLDRDSDHGSNAGIHDRMDYVREAKAEAEEDDRE